MWKAKHFPTDELDVLWDWRRERRMKKRLDEQLINLLFIQGTRFMFLHMLVGLFSQQLVGSFPRQLLFYLAIQYLVFLLELQCYCQLIVATSQIYICSNIKSKLIPRFSIGLSSGVYIILKVIITNEYTRIHT